MLKLWHEYFSCTEEEVKQVDLHFTKKVGDLRDNLKEMVSLVTEQLEKHKLTSDELAEQTVNY